MGNYNWISEGITFKTKILDVVYNATNNELMRTKSLVKNCIVVIDATAFKKWYSNHYAIDLGCTSILTSSKKKRFERGY